MSESRKIENTTPGQGKKISRRKFLGLATIGSILGTTAYTQLSKPDVAKNTTNRIAEAITPVQVVDFSAEEHKFRAIFWAHGRDGYMRNDLDKSEFVSDWPLVAETGLGPYLNEGMGARLLRINEAETGLRFTADNPLILNDVPPTNEGMAALTALKVISVLAAYGLYGESKTSRRGFVKAAAAGGAVWMSAGLAGLLSFISDSFLPREVSREVARGASTIELTQPHFILSALRSVVSGYKTLDLQTNANIMFGKGHWTIPAHMERGRQSLLNFISIYPPEVLDPFIADRRYLYTTLVVYRDDKQVRSTEIIHPELEKLFAS